MQGSEYQVSSFFYNIYIHNLYRIRLDSGDGRCIARKARENSASAQILFWCFSLDGMRSVLYIHAIRPRVNPSHDGKYGFFPKEKEKGIYSWILPMEVVTKGITGMPPDYI